MITQKTIKGLDFETIEDYFWYIIESRANGQLQQAKELFVKLSTAQKEEFTRWLKGTFGNPDSLKDKDFLIDTICYFATVK